jgi:hypothetical protein
MGTGVEFLPMMTQAFAGFAQARSEGAALDQHARMLQQQAGQERASAQRDAIEQRRQAKLVNSAVMARAGGGAGDVSVVDLMAGNAAEGEYRALLSLYHGEDRAKGLEFSAESKRLEAKDQRRAATLGAMTSVLSGAHDWHAKYGGDATQKRLATMRKDSRAGYGYIMPGVK